MHEDINVGAEVLLHASVCFDEGREISTIAKLKHNDMDSCDMNLLVERFHELRQIGVVKFFEFLGLISSVLVQIMLWDVMVCFYYEFLI